MTHSFTLHPDAWLSDGPEIGTGEVTGYRVSGMLNGAWARVFNFGAPTRNNWQGGTGRQNGLNVRPVQLPPHYAPEFRFNIEVHLPSNGLRIPLVRDKQLLQLTRLVVHTRNTICHMSTVTAEEHERLQQVMGDWFRVVAP